MSKLGVEDLLEDVLEPTVVGLEDRVLRGEIDRIRPGEAVAETGPGEIADRVVEVVHRHRHAGRGEFIHLHLERLGIVGGGEGERQRARSGNLHIGGAVLIAEGMAAHHNRLRPAGHEPRDIADDDRLAEDHAPENVADGAVGALPHLLELEFLNPGLVRGDRGALHAHAMFLDRMSRIDCDLIPGGVAVGDREVVILKIDVEVGENELVLDELPDDPRHLVAIEFHNRPQNLDLAGLAHGILLKGAGADGSPMLSPGETTGGDFRGRLEGRGRDAAGAAETTP